MRRFKSPPASPAVPLDARNDVWSLLSATAPDGRRTVPPVACQGVPNLAAGNARPNGGVRSRKLRLAVKRAQSSNNMTMLQMGMACGQIAPFILKNTAAKVHNTS